MWAKTKHYFGTLLHHWFLTLLLLFIVALFLSPYLNRAYTAIRARLTFLPDSKYGEV